MHQAWKAALAAAAAWQVAVVLPGPTDEYPYYAPLGAVLAMYPTVANSFRQAGQSLLAVCVGAGLAVLAVAAASPNTALVAAVVGMGTLVGGWRLVGEQASWVPASAVFVLVIGGNQPVGYLAGYLGQVAVGLVIGMGVNFVVFPPLYLGCSSQRLDDLRDTLAAQLEDLVDVVLGSGKHSIEEWRTQQRRLDPLVADVRTAVIQSDNARRANLRARWHRRQLDAFYHAVQPLERVAILIQDVDRVLRDEPDEAGSRLALDDDTRAPVANALAELAALLRAGEEDRAHNCLSQAEDAFSQLVEQLESRPKKIEYLSGATILVVDLRRALDELTPTADRASAPLNIYHMRARTRVGKAR